jgi:hypothetical protein
LTVGPAAVPQTTFPGGNESAFVIHWTETPDGADADTEPDGASQDWATYLGGSNDDDASAIELDEYGNAFVGGSTESLGISQIGAGEVAFPTLNPAGGCVNVLHSDPSNSQYDGFVTKLDEDGGLLCSGFFGGEGNDNVADGGLDNNGGGPGVPNFYLTGRTLSDNFDLGALAAGCGQSTRAGAADAFLARFNDECCLMCATYHGGDALDFGQDCDVLETSAATGGTTILVCGFTQSTNMPVSPGDNQGNSLATAAELSGSHTVTAGPQNDFFIVCFRPDCCRLWSAYWGGSADDAAHVISAAVIGGHDRIVVGGVTNSPDGGGSSYPTQDTPGGSNYFQSAVDTQPDGALLKFEFRPDEKLAIDLASFGVSAVANRVTLNWRTASEDHNAGFEIRRTELLTPYDKANSKPIANYLTNKELIGLGSSPVGKEYRFIDNDPALTAGRTYVYQLIDIANDGTRTPHPSVAVRLEAGGNETPTHEFRVDQVSPNPATDAASLSFSLRDADEVTIEIYSMDGKLLMTPVKNRSFTAGAHVEQIQVGTLPPGVYTAVVSTSDFTRVRTRQFVVVR